MAGICDPVVGVIQGGGVGGSDLSPFTTIATRAELVAISTTAAPTFTINSPVIVTAIISLDVGESVVSGELGVIVTFAPGSGGFSGNFAGPLLSGPLSVVNLICINVSVDADAFGYRVVSTMGRIPSVLHSIAAGPAGAMEITNVPGPSTVLDFAMQGSSRGVVVRNGTIGELALQLIKSATGVPGFVGVEIESTVTVTGSIGIDTPSFVVSSAQHGIAISDTATFSAGALVQVTSAKVSGDQARMFRQDVGDMDVNDNRLIISGSSSNNWAASIDIARTELSDPLIIAYAAANDPPIPLPYTTGVNTDLDVLGVTAHWRLVKDDPNVGDWYLVFDGAKAGAPHVPSYQMLIDRNAGTGAVEMMFERDTNPATDTWSPIATTVRSFDNTNSFRQQVSGAGDVTFSAGDRIRVSSVNLADAVNARAYDVTIQVRGA